MSRISCACRGWRNRALSAESLRKTAGGVGVDADIGQDYRLFCGPTEEAWLVKLSQSAATRTVLKMRTQARRYHCGDDLGCALDRAGLCRCLRGIDVGRVVDGGNSGHRLEPAE